MDDSNGARAFRMPGPLMPARSVEDTDEDLPVGEIVDADRPARVLPWPTHAGAGNVGIVLDTTPLPRPGLVIIHLFVGRRRQGDVQQAVESAFDGVACLVMVLSLDVIHSQKGDWTIQDNANFWREQIRLKRVVAVIGGHPCETWSVARFRDDGPPPVRSRELPWGMCSATSR